MQSTLRIVLMILCLFGAVTAFAENTEAPTGRDELSLVTIIKAIERGWENADGQTIRTRQALADTGLNLRHRFLTHVKGVSGKVQRAHAQHWIRQRANLRRNGGHRFEARLYRRQARTVGYGDGDGVIQRQRTGHSDGREADKHTHSCSRPDKTSMPDPGRYLVSDNDRIADGRLHMTLYPFNSHPAVHGRILCPDNRAATPDLADAQPTGVTPRSDVGYRGSEEASGVRILTRINRSGAQTIMSVGGKIDHRRRAGDG